jgi:hypothetical protein
MAEDKPDIYEQQIQRRREAYHRAPHLKEKYPQLARLIIKMSFTEPSWGSAPRPQQKVYGPDNKALFEVQCPHVECVEGGFDLRAAVSDMVTYGKSEVVSNLVCQGWQGREGINKHRCHLRVSYRISATYKSGAMRGTR